VCAQVGSIAAASREDPGIGGRDDPAIIAQQSPAKPAENWEKTAGIHPLLSAPA